MCAKVVKGQKLDSRGCSDVSGDNDKSGDSGEIRRDKPPLLRFTADVTDALLLWVQLLRVKLLKGCSCFGLVAPFGASCYG
jgi:hypothetical protein